VVCTGCGVANEPGRKFCSECGERLSQTCPACGGVNAPTDKFCGECGGPLSAAAPAGPPSSPASPASTATERRLVSVLFVDLVGFTPYSEAHDAEDVRAMLERYFDGASAAVRRHGGIVEKFIGDAVMAVWGTPIAHEDDAERAVRSALEIVDLVEAIGQEIGEPLQARAGVLTGEAVADVGAVDRGIVTGDLVNTTARLQSAAAPGRVLVGERTFRSAATSIAFEPVEPLVLKGKSEPVPAWVALRVISERGGSGRGTAPEPPFVGRDEEFRHTRELLHATGRDGRPRLLHVSGVAGIGKSRLVWELRKYTDGLSDDIFWHQGRCPAYGDGVAFWAFADMVRSRAGIADSDSDEVARAKLEACLHEYIDDEDERRWLEPPMAHLLGLDTAAPADKAELDGAWRRFVERVAERGTVVLVFEDLHWADPGLLDFVESLLEWSRTSPILVLTLARPELHDRRPSWGSRVRNATTLHLERLADDEIAAMVTGYVDGLPDDGLARLVDRAEGVPMYAVETVRMLADRGVLEQTGSTYRVTGDLGGELDIPETLQALVAARLDGLSATERALVQDAAVAGHSFTLEAVCAVGGHPAAEAETALRALVHKEVLDQDADPRSPERGQYRFVQAVIQEVAYATLSKAARRTKHVACASWYAALDDDDLAGVVASHFLEAYRAEPAAADAPSVAEHAREWLARAGARASSLGSQDQALTYAELGLTLTEEPSQRQALHQRASLAASLAGQRDAGLAHCREARRLGRHDDNVADEVTMTIQLTRAPYGAEIEEEIAGWLLELLDEGTGLSPPARTRVLAALADRACVLGHTEEALRYSEAAIVHAQQWADDGALRQAASARAFALTMAGRRYEARLLYDSFAEMSREKGSPFEQAAALMQLGVFLFEGEVREAVQVSLEAAELAARAGALPLRRIALANASEGAVDLGEWDVAEAALSDAEVIGMTDGFDQDGLELTRCMLLAHRGHHEEASAVLQELESDRWDGWTALQMRTWFLRARGMCRLLAGDDAGAADDFRRLVTDFDLDINTSGGLLLVTAAAAGRRDPAAIEAFLDRTAVLSGAWVDLAVAAGRATVAALEGASGGAAAFDALLDDWIAASYPLDHAFTVLCAVRALPAEQVPPGHLDRARDYLRELGGVALLARIDAAAPSTTS
jgi:class 3 adenylate cyclase/tetratricopeptide (TPR) repeat protein